MPNDELGAVATSEMWAEIYDRIAGTSGRTARPWSLSIRGACRSESRTHLAERLGENVVLPITAAYRERCGSMPKRG